MILKTGKRWLDRRAGLNISASRWLFLTLSVLTGAGFYFFPWISDDLHYRMPFRNVFIAGEPSRLMDFLGFFKHVYLWNNGRIANFAMLLHEYLPHWFQALSSTVMMWLMLSCGAKFICSWRMPWLQASVWACSCVLFLPWIDQMYVQDFQLNYLWAGAMGAGLAFMVIRTEASVISCASVAALVGVWQEAVAFPLMAGFAALWLMYPSFRNVRTATVILVLLAGLVYLYTAQGARLYRMTSLGTFSLRMDILSVYALVPLALAAMVALRSFRRKCVEPGLAFLTVSALAAMSLMLYAAVGPRVGWWGVQAGLMGLVMCMKTDAVKIRKSVAIVCASLVAFTVVHLLAVDLMCYRIGATYRKVLESTLRSPGEPVFIDMPLRETAPLICLQKPYYNMFSHYPRCASYLNFIFRKAK